MKALLVITLLSLNFTYADNSSCKEKVLSYHKNTFHKTIGAARNTFLNNFIGRKNTLAHAFGYPEIAFQNRLILGENYIASNMISKVECSGLNGTDIYQTYLSTLESNELCNTLGDDYKKPRQIRKFLYLKLGIE